MPYGIALDNSNGKRVIGSDTVLPRFIGKYTESALGVTSNYGDFLKFSVICDGKPMCFLHVPIGYAASINRIVTTSTNHYDVYVYIPDSSSAMTFSDIVLYLFSDGQTTSTTSGYGINIKKADDEVAYDTGYGHAKIQGYFLQKRFLWVWVSNNEALNFTVGDTIYNKTKGTNAVYMQQTYTNILSVAGDSAAINWAAGDLLSDSASGATLATIGTNAITSSYNTIQQPAVLAGGATWSSLGISKPAIFYQPEGKGFWGYMTFGSWPYYSFFHLYAHNTVTTASDGFVWGFKTSSYPTGTTRADWAATAPMSVGFGTDVTHSIFDTCALNASYTPSQLFSDYYGYNSHINWSSMDAQFFAYIIDGADYD
jgi:hypothetical protein